MKARHSTLTFLITSLFICGIVNAADYSLFKLELIMAEKGDPEAQFNVGHAYEQGQDAPKDIKQAFYWYQKAAKQNHDFAQYSIGLMYERGNGVKKDLEEAKNWYKLAANNGNQLASQRLSDSNKPAQKAETKPTQIEKPKPTVVKRPQHPPVIKQVERPKPVQQRVQNPAEILNIVLRGKWKYNGTPADFLPSSYAHCLPREDSEIICFTSERKKLLDRNLISFTTKSTISDFSSDGRFTVNYLYNVTSISSADQAGPANDPLGLEKKPGWQKPNLTMQCETGNNSRRLTCNRANKRYIFTR